MSIPDPQSSAQREPPIEIGGDISGGLPGCPGNWVRDGSEVGEPVPIRRGDRRPAYAEPHLFGGGGGKTRGSVGAELGIGRGGVHGVSG